MESHALHADGLYYESGDKLWVNLYAPSKAEWKAAGVKLEVATDMPLGETVTIDVTPQAAKKFTLALRRPLLGGQRLQRQNQRQRGENGCSGGFVCGDRADLEGGGQSRTHHAQDAPQRASLAGNPNRFAVMWGPLVLAGDLGPATVGRAPGAEVPILVAPEQPVANWLKPVAGKPGTFRTAGVGLKQEIDFAPFYQLPRRRYAVYWDMYSPAGVDKKGKPITGAGKKSRRSWTQPLSPSCNPGRCRRSAMRTSRGTAARRYERRSAMADPPQSGFPTTCPSIVRTR